MHQLSRMLASSDSHAERKGISREVRKEGRMGRKWRMGSAGEQRQRLRGGEGLIRQVQVKISRSLRKVHRKVSCPSHSPLLLEVPPQVQS